MRYYWKYFQKLYRADYVLLVQVEVFFNYLAQKFKNSLPNRKMKKKFSNFYNILYPSLLKSPMGPCYYKNYAHHVQVRGIEITIVVLVLMVWVGAIIMFFNRWGKIRMLIPYQPDYKDTQLKVPGTGACNTTSSCQNQPGAGFCCSQVSVQNSKTRYSLGNNRP